MEPKSHKVVVRISENQAHWLAHYLNKEHTTKSELIRNALNAYLIENTRGIAGADKISKARDDD